MEADDDQYADIPTRPMRVKVLYTFDQESVAIDENAQVGIIELRECLRAVTTASPELLSRLSDGDFTVYAYDYSEFDTPLVGQGMLSAALHATLLPTGAEKPMITGRVCKNVPALFSNGVKETLEVKLRLVPVARPVQIESTRVTDNPRSMSPAMSAGFDPNAWNASRSQPQPSDYFNFDAASIGGDGSLACLNDDLLGLEYGSTGGSSGLGMMGVVGPALTPVDPLYDSNPALAHSAPGSRAGSPMMGPEFSSHNERLRHQSFSGQPTNFSDQFRPDSRASVRSEVQYHRHQAPSPPSHQEHPQPQCELYYNEDGQTRKRAKTTQVDWRGKSSFGSKSADLRVTAATAASMHMFRPIPKRPSAPGTDLEPPPRVPTPVPQLNPSLPRRRPLSGSNRSFLREASSVESDCMSDVDQFSDAIASSPDEDSPGQSVTADGTPRDIPSSPPVLQTFNLPQPSSPQLPIAHATSAADSGYMSDRLSFVDYVQIGDDEDPSPKEADSTVQNRSHVREPQSFIKREGLVLPAYRTDHLPGEAHRRHEASRMNLPSDGHRGPNQGLMSATDWSEDMSATFDKDRTATARPFESRRGSLALPSLPQPVSSGTQRESSRRPSVQRTRTSSNESESGSPAPSDTEGRPRGSKSSKSGRRTIITQRMHASIASGEMPQYCIHCGAIETPTWRKLYVKECEGKPSGLDRCEGEGETIGIEVIETDEQTGEAVRFIIRKSMKKTREAQPGAGFQGVTVCNPCGLWFNKSRTMRPSDKWSRKTGSRKSKKAGSTRDGSMIPTDGTEPQSDAFFSDRVASERMVHDGDAGDDEVCGNATVEGEMRRSRSKHRRATSMGPQPNRRPSGGDVLNASQLNAALTRAVQSSPVPFRGSQDSPIEIDDLTPRPTRRLLFPSPRKDGEVKSLDDNGQVSLHAAVIKPSGKSPSKAKLPGAPLQGLAVGNQDTNFNVFETFTFDKENVAPDGDLDDSLMHLFEGSPSTACIKTPYKPVTPASQRYQSLKTPTPASRKRKALYPADENATNGAIPIARPDDFLTSPPSSSRYYLRATPSRQLRTPDRGSQLNTAANAASSPSPFSRHLAQMLSDGSEGLSGSEGANFLTSPRVGAGGERAFEYGDLPTFTTPGREVNWKGLDEILSSDIVTCEEDGL